MLRQIGVPEGARLLVCGSTHEGEEAILAGQLLHLRRKFPDLFLVVVPRHFERGKAVGKDLSAAGVKFVFRSEITVNTRFEPGQVECLLVNTTGELRYFYEQATVIFVGKSLCGRGGQNRTDEEDADRRCHRQGKAQTPHEPTPFPLPDPCLAAGIGYLALVRAAMSSDVNHRMWQTSP